MSKIVKERNRIISKYGKCEKKLYNIRKLYLGLSLRKGSYLNSDGGTVFLKEKKMLKNKCRGKVEFILVCYCR